MQVVFQFDVRAVVLFIAMTFLVQATAIGAQAYLTRDLRQYRGIRTAVIANVVVAVGILLRLFIDRLPDFLSIILGNMLMLWSPGLFYIALGKFTGFAYSRTVVAIVMGIVFLLLLYFTYWQDNMGIRMIAISTGAVIMIALLVHQLLQARFTALQFSANLMLVTFISFGTFLTLRTINMLLSPPQAGFNTSTVQSATYMIMFAFSFFWSIGFILMVSQRLRNDLMEMASTDALTGISNRRATQLFLEKELSRIQRNEDVFSILLIDIDHFKHVNDRWGHSIGDAVLVKTAAIFQSMIRKEDWVGRWGGEEFLIIVPGSRDVETLAERLRSEVSHTSFHAGAQTFGITISVGIAFAHEKDRLDEILRSADEALYHSKQTRNTITTSSSLSEG